MSDNHEMEFVAGVGWYEGEYKNGKFDGKGSFTFSDGRRYEGQFQNGEKHGKGTFTFPDGRKYVGEWENGERNGQGTVTSTDGYRYVGEFREDKPWNTTHHDKDGNIFGKYVDGNWCSEEPN